MREVREAAAMTALAEALRPMVDVQLVPGLVAAVGWGDQIDVVVLGDLAVDGRPMAEDALFRIASITKPMVAALALTFVADGTLQLDGPVGELLPELAAPVVVRSMTGPVDDTVPASRPITLRHLLTSTNGHGFPSDFSAPVAQLLVDRLVQGPPQPQRVPPPDEWMAILGGIPLLHQPGEGFTVQRRVRHPRRARRPGRRRDAARAHGEAALRTAGDDGDRVRLPRRDGERRTSYYRHGDDGLAEQDGPDGQWATVPPFPSGAGGLVSTLADVVAFQRMLLAGGGDLLPADLVAAMTTDQLTPAIRSTDSVFLDGQSWGFGGGVDIAALHPWNVTGRYGWVGGTGTSAHVVPSDGSIAVLLTQVELAGPTGSQVIERFWTAASEHLDRHLALIAHRPSRGALAAPSYPAAWWSVDGGLGAPGHLDVPLQLHAGNTFADVAEAVPFLAELGISHLYLSPVLQAPAGSSHGYDTVDVETISKELGGAGGPVPPVPRGPRAWAWAWWSTSCPTTWRSAIAPTAGGGRCWPKGRTRRTRGSSTSTGTRPSRGCRGTIVLPVLDDHYGRALERGAIRVVSDDAELFVVAVDDDLVLPLSAATVGEILLSVARRAG